MDTLVEEVLCLGNADYQARLAQPSEKTLEQPGELALSEGDYLLSFLLL